MNFNDSEVRIAGGKDSGTNDGTWKKLLSSHYAGICVVLCGGVGLYATNVYLTTSLLPSAIMDIGGEKFYSWCTTIFLLASVIFSVLVGKFLQICSGRGAYWIAASFFLLGSIICAISPTMFFMLLGRAIQGAGGGLLSGLSYALIRSNLPADLWAKGTALISAMFGVGTVVGPALGGLFAQLHMWRWVFWSLVITAIFLMLIVPFALSHQKEVGDKEGFPFLSLILIAGAALLISIASVINTRVLVMIFVLLGLVLIIVFVCWERFASSRILPMETFTRHSHLKMLYITIALCAIGSNVEGFVPYFSQRIAQVGPLIAGFIGAALAFGWTLGEIPSSSIVSDKGIDRVLVIGPIFLTLGLALTMLAQQDVHPAWLIILWAITLLLAGIGIGLAWPHIASRVMSSSHNASEGNKAAAAINTVQLLANALGASVAGLVVNLNSTNDISAARSLYGIFALITFFAIFSGSKARLMADR